MILNFFKSEWNKITPECGPDVVLLRKSSKRIPDAVAMLCTEYILAIKKERQPDSSAQITITT